MRYRGKAEVEFITGTKRTVEHVVNVDDIETANKICAIEFFGSYGRNDRVRTWRIVPCVEDHMERPSTEFVKEHLIAYGDSSKTVAEHEEIRAELYRAFETYQPFVDDDGLSDAFSDCEISTNRDLDLIAENLLESLDGFWCCHYNPPIKIEGLQTRSLEEQYLDTIRIGDLFIDENGDHLNVHERTMTGKCLWLVDRSHRSKSNSIIVSQNEEWKTEDLLKLTRAGKPAVVQ